MSACSEMSLYLGSKTMIKHVIDLRLFVLLGFLTLLVACAGLEGSMGRGSEMGSNMVAQAVKDALQLSIKRATTTLSQSGAYGGSDQYQIGYSEDVEKIVGILHNFGLSGPLDKVKSTVNNAAELAAAEAQSVMLSAVDSMTITDALAIVSGGKTAATDFFEQATRSNLNDRYSTILENKLQAVSFYPSYQSLLKTYRSLPIPNKPDIEIEKLAVNKGLDALYSEIAAEETKIRDNPKEQGSLIISSVFGG